MVSSFSPELIIFIKEREESDSSPDDNIRSLNGFVSDLNAKLQKRKNDLITSYKESTKDDVFLSAQNIFSFMIQLSSKVREKIYSMYNQYFSELIKTINLVIDFIKSNHTKSVCSSKLIEYMRAGKDNEGLIIFTREVKHSIFQYKCIEKRIRKTKKRFPSKDLREVVNSTFTRAFYKYDIEMKYTAAGMLDVVLPIYLRKSSYSCMIDPILFQITNESVPSAIVTLAEFTELFCEDFQFGMTAEVLKYVAYTAIVRYFFDEAYIIKPFLFLNNQKNITFLEKCEHFSQTSVVDLNIPSRIKQRCVPNLSAVSLFKEKHLKYLSMIQYMNNPIDIMLHLLTAQNQIAKYFKSKDDEPLTSNEIAAMMLVLISVNPPINAVSIAIFLKKWGDIKLEEGCESARELFIEAVELIYSQDFCENEEDENENNKINQVITTISSKNKEELWGNEKCEDEEEEEEEELGWEM